MGDLDGVVLRHGGPADAGAVLRLLDDATAWLVARGRTGQWGSGPASTDPRRIAQADAWATGGGLWLAEVDGRPVGALVVGTATEYVPPATEPELYVNLLVTDRAYAGRGIGGRLLAHAADLARQRGVGLLRVDCYAGDDAHSCAGTNARASPPPTPSPSPAPTTHPGPAVLTRPL